MYLRVTASVRAASERVHFASSISAPRVRDYPRKQWDGLLLTRTVSDRRPSPSAARGVDLTPSSKEASMRVLADGRVKRSAPEWRKGVRSVRGEWSLGAGVLPAGRDSAHDLHAMAAAREGRALAGADGGLRRTAPVGGGEQCVARTGGVRTLAARRRDAALEAVGHVEQQRDAADLRLHATDPGVWTSMGGSTGSVPQSREPPSSRANR